MCSLPQNNPKLAFMIHWVMTFTFVKCLTFPREYIAPNVSKQFPLDLPNLKAAC